MALKWDSRKKIAKAIDSRATFRNGNISGRWITEPLSGWDAGQLPSFLRDQINATIKEADTYVVFSYGTPIGWSNGSDGKHNWFIPTVTYSQTTTHHQSVVMVSILPDSPYLLD